MTFDAQVQTITQDQIVPKVVDQVLAGNAFAMVILGRQARPWYGESLKVPVKLFSHTQGGSFSDYGTFKTANENVRQYATFDPRAYYQSVVLGGIARSINGITKTQLLSLVKVEMESVMQDMVDDIGSLFQGDGTGNSSQDFLGVKAAIDDGNTVSSYGSLSRTTYDKWQSALYTSIGAWDFTKARTLWNKAQTGNQKPNFAYCDETTFSYVEADYTAITNFQVNTAVGNRSRLTMNGMVPATTGGLVGEAGYESLYFDGTPIVRDEKANAQEMVVMNTNYNFFYGVKAIDANPVDISSLYHDGNDYAQAPKSLGFAWTGFVRPYNQYAFIGQILLIGNYVNHAPRLSTRGTTISS